MSTIANAKVAHNYNRYNGYFFGCLRFDDRDSFFYGIYVILNHAKNQKIHVDVLDNVLI